PLLSRARSGPMPQKDAAAAAHVEQSIVRRQLQRLQYRFPGERMHVVRAVCLTRGASVRPALDLVGQAVDPPFTDRLQDQRSRMKPWRAALTSATASGNSTRM